MKITDINQYSIIKVIIHSFGHAVNGNPTAHHAVEAYKDLGGPELSIVLYKTARRAQVCYAERYESYVPALLKRAGINLSELTRSNDRLGGRAEGRIEIVYYTNKVL